MTYRPQFRYLTCRECGVRFGVLTDDAEALCDGCWWVAWQTWFANVEALLDSREVAA